jgi:hypothetical protein
VDNELQFDPNQFIPALQQETGRVLAGLLADLAAKDVVIQQLQEQVQMYEKKMLENTE